MLETVEKAGVFAGYLEDLCYTPKSLKAVASVRAGAIGDVTWVRSRETHPGPHSAWFWDGRLTGGGAIVDGRPLLGAAGYAGEVGHIPVNPNGTACRCGSVGCWETEVGEGALLRRAGHPPGGGPDAVEAVIAEARDGSPAALSAFDDVGHWLGIGLAGLINILNPRLVLLGGRFGRIHPFVATTLEGELDRRVLPAPRRLVRVVPTALGVDAPLLGAAELAFEPLLTDPATWLPPRDAFVDQASA